MAMGSTVKASIGIAVAFELAAHILVHYTVPGAQFASWLAQGIAPVLDSVGLTTVFAQASGGAAASQLASLPTLSGLAAG